MYATTGDRSVMFDFAREREIRRKADALKSLAVWLASTLIFGSWGGYVMYQSMDAKSILAGLLLLFCAVATAFLAICAGWDAFADPD